MLSPPPAWRRACSLNFDVVELGPEGQQVVQSVVLLPGSRGRGALLRRGLAHHHGYTDLRRAEEGGGRLGHGLGHGGLVEHGPGKLAVHPQGEEAVLPNAGDFCRVVEEGLDRGGHLPRQTGRDADREADVVVIDNWQTLGSYPYDSETAYVWHTGKDDFFNHHTLIARVLPKVARLNVVITDVESFDKEDLEDYRLALQSLAREVAEQYLTGSMPQLNLLTDRMMLGSMNNCDAGWHSLTLAPNGKFYICPAFYQEDEANSVGDLAHGLKIPNPQLYQLEYAPICRRCDAYQCKRCIWLNRNTTLEVNTPSREQCVTAHLERNASRQLLATIRQAHKDFLPDAEIKEIDYLDPFEICRR